MGVTIRQRAFMLCTIHRAINAAAEDYKKKITELKQIPKLIKETLEGEEKIQLIAKDIFNSKGSMFLGRGLSFPIALEGALKL